MVLFLKAGLYHACFLLASSKYACYDVFILYTIHPYKHACALNHLPVYCMNIEHPHTPAFALQAYTAWYFSSTNHDNVDNDNNNITSSTITHTTDHRGAVYLSM